MKHLFEPAAVNEMKDRIARLRPDSAREWGSMTPAQMLAHCCGGFEVAVGEKVVPRHWLGRILGPVAKRSLITQGKAMRRNSPTGEGLRVIDERDFTEERQRLLSWIDRFAAGGPVLCTSHPHFFFGPLTPVEWSSLMYQHLDHHLRQFNA